MESQDVWGQFETGLNDVRSRFGELVNLLELLPRGARVDGALGGATLRINGQLAELDRAVRRHRPASRMPKE